MALSQMDEDERMWIRTLAELRMWEGGGAVSEGIFVCFFFIAQNNYMLLSDVLF